MPTLEEPQILLYSIPAFVVLLLLEGYIAWRKGTDSFERKDTWASLLSGVGNVLVTLPFKALMLGVFFLLYELTPLRMGHAWWAWVLCFLAVEHQFYWAHRFGHESRIGWAGHVPHHSSTKYNLSTALRQPWAHHHLVIFYMAVPLLGFDPMMFLWVNSIATVYQFWIHTEHIGKLPRWFEFLFNTPSHHRVHHGSNPRYLDRNYGASLIIWDRVYGTFQEELEEDPVQYGLTKNIGTYNLLRIHFAEFGAIARDAWRARGLGNKLRYIFASPGWAAEHPTDPRPLQLPKVQTPTPAKQPVRSQA